MQQEEEYASNYNWFNKHKKDSAFRLKETS